MPDKEQQAPLELQQRSLDDLDDEGQEQDQEQDQEHGGDNELAREQVGQGHEPPPDLEGGPQIQPPHELAVRQLSPQDLDDRPVELEEHTGQHAIDSDWDRVTEGTITGAPANARDFANKFKGNLAPLRELARATFQSVADLGVVELTKVEKLALWHSRNYERFTVWSESKSIRNTGKKSYNPIRPIGLVFWGDMRRGRRARRQEQRGEDVLERDLKPGEATFVRYQQRVRARMLPLIAPLVQAVANLRRDNHASPFPGYEEGLLVLLQGFVVAPKARGILNSLAG